MDSRDMFFLPEATRPFSNWDPNPLRYVQLDAPVLEIDVAELWGHDRVERAREGGWLDDITRFPSHQAVKACKIFLTVARKPEICLRKEGGKISADFQPKLDINTFSGFICVKLPPRKRVVLFFLGGGSANFWGQQIFFKVRSSLGKVKRPPRPKGRRI